MSPDRLVRIEPTRDEPADAGPLAIRMPVDVRSAALTVLATLSMVMVLKIAAAMIIPIVLGILISYALDPPVTWMERHRLPRAISAAVVVIALVVGSGWLLYALRFEGQAIVEKLPQAARQVRRSLENDRPTSAAAIQQVQKAATELEKAATAAATPPPAPRVRRSLQAQARQDRRAVAHEEESDASDSGRHRSPD